MTITVEKVEKKLKQGKYAQSVHSSMIQKKKKKAYNKGENNAPKLQNKLLKFSYWKSQKKISERN